MVTLLVAATLQAGGAPAPVMTYAARFDCAVQSTIAGEPYHGPHREIVTFEDWRTAIERPMIEVDLNDGRVIRHPGTLYRAQVGEGGFLSLAVGSVAFIWLTRTASDPTIRYRSTYYLHHGDDPVETAGTCALDLRQPPIAGAIPEWEAE